MPRQRTIKVWNKIVTINDVPDHITDDELIAWTKIKLMQEEIIKGKSNAS